jgi:hypothetical protein
MLKMPPLLRPHRAFGVLLMLLHKAFKHFNPQRRPMTPMKPKRNPRMVAFLVTLITILVVLPTAATIVVRIAEERWVAAHPPETLVPDVTGIDWQAAAAAVRSAQLKPVISSTAIDAKCWQDQPAPDTIVEQDPEPLTPVTVGTDVHLVIGRAVRGLRSAGNRTLTHF